MDTAAGGRYPEGPLTILFSDVEGSTELRTERGDAAAHRILRAHEEIVRACLDEHHGREVKALGDGFMIAFASVRNALVAAVAIQRSLAEHNRTVPGEEILVRIGINTGEVAVEGDDLYGQAVNAAARIAARAAGGEILVSEIVHQLAGSGPEFSFRDRGRIRLKGFPDRWRLYELCCDPDGEPASDDRPGAGEVRLLGPFELVSDGGAGPGGVEIGSVKQRAVLALLALRVNQVVSRDALLDRLWPGEPPASATVTLRSLVSRLRKVLETGDTFELQTREPGWVLRAGPDAVDAARFEALLAKARACLDRDEAPAAVTLLRDALALWRGDALVDLVGAGYLTAEATRLDEARLAAVETLAEAELTSGRAADALARLEAHVAAHPLREAAWGQLMTALYRLGRQAEALRAYQRIRALLADELGIDPTPALVDLEARILRHDPTLAPPVPVPSEAESGDAAPIPQRVGGGVVAPGPGERTPFVGRGPERAVLAALFERARQGVGGMVLIGGEPGIGKTRLAKECAAEATRQGMAVVAGHSYEMAGASPYVAVVEILEGALEAASTAESFVADVLGEGAPEIARLVPQLRRRLPNLPAPLDLPPAQERQYLFRCLGEAFARLAAARPTVVLLDDLQWADEPTLLFVEHLAPQLAQLPLAVVATYRDADVGRPLARTFEDLHRRRLAQRIRLGALSPTEAAEVVEALTGQPPPPGLADGLHAATDGNIFFLEEVLSDLVEQGRLLDETGRFRADLDFAALGVPEGVRLVISRRLERLSDDAQRLLAAAAVAGRVFSVRLLEALGDLDPDRVLDVLDEAEGATLVQPAGDDEYLFAHELIRQTLTGALSGPRRRRAHLKAADAMIAVWAGQLEEHAAEIAHHLAEAGDTSDPKTRFRFSFLAGQRALQTSAFEEALAHLERAVALEAVATGPERGELFHALARARQSLGRFDEGTVAWERTIAEYEALADTQAVGRICWELGMFHLYAGHVPEAEANFRRGLAALGDAVTAVRARILSGLGFSLVSSRDVVGGDAAFDEARRVTDELADPALAALVGGYWQMTCHASMRAKEALVSGRMVADGLLAAGELWALGDALWAIGWNLWCVGRFEESVPLLEDFAVVSRKVGQNLRGFEGRATGPREFFRSGDLDVLEGWIRHDIETCDELMGGAWNSWVYAWMGTIGFWRGDRAAADRWFRQSIDTVVVGGYDGWCWGSWFLHLVHTGRRAEALAVYEEHAGELPIPGRPNGSGGWGLLFAFAEGLYVLDERDRSAALYPLIVEAQEWTGVVVAPYAPGQLLERVAGVAAAAGGDHARAEAHYLTALRQAGELPHRFEQFETRCFYARLLAERAGSGDLAQAQLLLKEAADGFAGLHIPGQAQAARDALASLA